MSLPWHIHVAVERTEELDIISRGCHPEHKRGISTIQNPDSRFSTLSAVLALHCSANGLY